MYDLSAMGKAFETLATWLHTREAAGDQRTAGAPALPLEKPTILIIDDEPNFLSMEATLLRSYGFNVLSASSGVKGLNMMRYAPQDIHVVLLDYSMPEFDGAQTLEHLRQLSPHTKVIAVTGASPDDIPKSFRTGADFFVQKPFQSQELLAAIKVALTPSSTPSNRVQPGRG